MSRDERSPNTADVIGPSPVIARGSIEPLGLLPNASNGTLLVRCRLGDDEELAVYKPAGLENPLWDFAEGTLHRREVAAYEVAATLGWPAVPPTVRRDGPFGPGSVQRFVAFDPDHHFFTLQDERADDFREIAAFDLVVNNADRKGGHCLLDETGGIWAIDHGVCFSAEPKLRTVIWDFVDEPIPEMLLADLRILAVALEPRARLATTLSQLLDDDEVIATGARVAALIAAARFPAPDPSTRPFPWPPI